MIADERVHIVFELLSGNNAVNVDRTEEFRYIDEVTFWCKNFIGKQRKEKKRNKHDNKDKRKD